MSATLLPSPLLPTARQRDHLSWSAIATYRTCPLKYYFRYVAGLPEETVSASLVFGAAIHRAIEHHFRQRLTGAPLPSFHDLFDCYQAEWTNRGQVNFGATESRQSLDETAGRLLTCFQRSALSRPEGNVLAVEAELRGQVMAGVPELWGIVDLIVETPDELVIIDWKTSRARWSDVQVQDGAEQLLLYTELTRGYAPGKSRRLELAILLKTKSADIERYLCQSMQRR